MKHSSNAIVHLFIACKVKAPNFQKDLITTVVIIVFTVIIVIVVIIVFTVIVVIIVFTIIIVFTVVIVITIITIIKNVSPRPGGALCKG